MAGGDRGGSPFSQHPSHWRRALAAQRALLAGGPKGRGGQHGLCSFDQHLDRGQVGLVLVVPLIGRVCLFGAGRIGLGVWWRFLRALWELGSAGREDQFNRKCQICLFDTILTHQRSTCPRKRQRLQRCAQRPDSQPGRDFGHFANGAVGHRNAGQKQARLGQCGKIQGKFGRVR